MLACLSPNGMNRFDGASPPTRLLVATSDGVNVLERSGPDAAWRASGTTLAKTHATTLATVPGEGGVFVGTHGDGVFYSADGGKNWAPRNTGLSIIDVYSLATIACDGGVTVYAGTQPASMFRSRDLGGHWEEMPAMRQVPGTEFWTFPAPPRIAHTKMIVFDPRNPDWIYAAVEQGALLKTRDGGRTWRELDSYSRPDDRAYRDVHQVMVMRTRPETVFMTTGVGLYRSDDGGDSWERLTGEEFRIAYPDHMMLSPDERTLFMSGAKFHPGFWMSTHVADTTIARSRDLGKTWDTEPHGFAVAPRANLEAMTMAVYPGGYSLFVGDTEGTVHESDDGGDSWTRIADAVGPVTKGNHAEALRGERRPRAAAPA